MQAILGSGTSPGMLQRSGITDADMLVAATDSDEVNLIACMLARQLNPYLLKVARLRNPEYLEMKDLLARDTLGIDHIINPESAMVQTIRNLMLVPGASDVIDFVDGRIKLIGVTIRGDSPVAGKRLLSFQEMTDKLLVGAIVRGDKVHIPHGEDTIQAGDLVYVVARSGELQKIFRFFQIKEEELRRVIIVGGGQTGTALAKALDKTKISTRLVDRDPARCEELAEALDRVIVIHGDGTDRDLLLEENVKNADFLVALTSDEESNVLISLLGKGLGVRRIITRINKLSYIPLVSSMEIEAIGGYPETQRAAFSISRNRDVLTDPMNTLSMKLFSPRATATAAYPPSPASRRMALAGLEASTAEALTRTLGTLLSASSSLALVMMASGASLRDRFLTTKIFTG